MSLDEIKELDALVGKISFKVERPVEDKPKKVVNKRMRKAAEGSDTDIRNAKTKEVLREQLRGYILEQIKTRHVPMAEVTTKAQNIAPQYNGKKHRVSANVIRDIVKELEDEQKVTRYLDGNIFRIAPSSRNQLDMIFAPKPNLHGVANVHYMEDFGHRDGGIGSKPKSGYSSYYRNESAWPEAAGW